MDDGRQPPRPPPLLAHRKRVPLSPPSSPPQLVLKRTRDLPDLSLCHSCGRRFPSANNTSNLKSSNPNPRSNPIRVLRSQWRILLLCRTCLDGIRSADLCSYCFLPDPDDVAPSPSLRCGRCSRRVHFRCLPREHRCFRATWQKLSKGESDLNTPSSSFACIDCSPVLNFSFKNQNGDLLDELVNTTVDADVARDLEEDKDEELALKLHLEINGSPRVSRSNEKMGLVTCSGNAKSGKRDRVIEKLEFCRGSDGLSLNSIKKRKKAFDDQFYGLDSNTIVLALACARNIIPGESPEIEKKNSSFAHNLYSKRYSKKESASKRSLATKESKKESSDRYMKKYTKRKAPLKSANGKDESQCDIMSDNRYMNKYTKRKLRIHTDGAHQGSDRNLKKYTKNKLGLMGNPNANENQVGSDRFLKKYSKKLKAGTVDTEESKFGVCTAFSNGESTTGPIN